MEVTVAESNERTAGDSRRSRRTCVGCGERADAAEADLIRVVLGPEGEIAIDPGNGGFGRGAHVHARPACLARAAAGGLARAAKAKPMWRDASGALAPLREGDLRQGIADVFARRVDALLSTAKRAGALHVGADAVVALCRRLAPGANAPHPVVVVASDAAAGADTDEVRRAVVEGRAVAWGTKATLGASCKAGGPEGVAVVGIESHQLGAAVRAAVAVVTACSIPARAPASSSPSGGSRAGGKGAARASASSSPVESSEAGEGSSVSTGATSADAAPIRDGGGTPPRQSRTERGS